jgi:hypothetical protein
VDLALDLRSKTVGLRALQTQRTMRLKAHILSALGHDDEALPIAQAVAEAMAASTALGPVHPYTLAGWGLS